jgi:arginase
MIKVIGIPYDGNSSFLKGPALAPPRIRLMGTEGSANAFSEDGNEIAEGKSFHDLGDISFHETDTKVFYDRIYQKIKQELTGSDKILCLGGDHSIVFPIVDAFSEKFDTLNILQCDAHPDLYDSFDDNPFSHASPFARIIEKGRVRSLTQVGIRTLNTHQKQQAEKFGVRMITMSHFNLDFIKQLDGPLYISVDVDVLDPAFAPGISHHEPGGLTTRELIRIIQAIPVPIVGADIVEYNPTRDIHNMTAMVAYKLFKELVSKMME